MRAFPLVLSTMALATSACVPYRARPIDPSANELRYRARSLEDSGLRNFVQRNVTGSVAEWPPRHLDFELLTLVSLYYSPDLEVARSAIDVAAAEAISAGSRINPSLALEGGYSRNPESHLLYGILPSLTVETAGKRGYRILHAEQELEVARISLSETAWRVRSRLRSAFIDYLLAELRLEQLRDELAIRSEMVEMIDLRLSLGEAARPELDVFRVDLISSEAAVKAAEGDLAEARVVLASAAGVPSAALDGFTINGPALDSLRSLESLPLLQVQRAGLLHRADVARNLAEYAVAETAVRLEVARQYPDIELAPSYSFEEGFARYAIGATLGFIPLFHRNQGPIAVAESRRRQAEVLFNATQSRAISEMEKALARYRSAFEEFNEATNRLATIQQERVESVQRALDSGNADRMDLAMVRLESVTAARTRLEALAKVQAALGFLEDAAQYPLESGKPLPMLLFNDTGGKP